MGIFFGCNVYKCVQMCTAKAIFFRPSGSDNPTSTAKAALQASGRRVSIVVVQISFRDGKLPPWQMPRALDAERHAISQELPSHSRLPVCRPRDWALACRQSRLLCAWPASFEERLVHSMQSFTPSVRTVAAAHYLFIYLLFSIVARRCRPCAVLPPLYLWLGVADLVRFYRSEEHTSELQSPQ